MSTTLTLDYPTAEAAYWFRDDNGHHLCLQGAWIETDGRSSGRFGRYRLSQEDGTLFIPKGVERPFGEFLLKRDPMGRLSTVCEPEPNLVWLNEDTVHVEVGSELFTYARQGNILTELLSKTPLADVA